MTEQLPAVVTIPDLPLATTLSSSALFEAAQTTNSVGESVAVTIQQIMTSAFGGLPIGGTVGQFLGKSSATNFASGWVSLSSQVSASTGIAIAGSTSLSVSLSTIAGLSVLGVAGTATSAPIQITASGGSLVLQSNAGGTGLLFGSIASALPGPFQTTSLAVNQVLIGNGTNAIQVSGVGTAAWPLVGNGTALAPSFAVLSVPGGGINTTTLTLNGVLYGNGTSTPGITAAGATGSVLNVLAGVPAFTTSPTIATSVTVPLIVGGSSTTQTLTHKTTTGVGTTGADHIFLVGSNGATEAMRVTNTGNLGLGVTLPGAKLVISNTSTNTNPPTAALFQVVGDTNSTVVAGIDGYTSIPVLQFRKAAGSAGGPAAVLTGTLLFSFGSAGYNGTAFSSNALAIAGTAMETWNTTSNGAAIDIFATANGTSSLGVKVVARFQSGIQVGTPTGGDKGAGSINVSGDIYKNNTAYTNPDYVLEFAYGNGIVNKFFNHDGAQNYTGRLGLPQLREYTRTHLRLPRITDEPLGLFQRGDVVLEKIEELTLDMLDLHDRITNLETRAKTASF